MKLLKVSFDHLRMFEGGLFELDLFAFDKVPAGDESATALAGTIYSNNILGIAGINASGKTTALALLELAGRIVNGVPVLGGGIPETVGTYFDGGSNFKGLVYEEGNCYLVESQLVCGEGESSDGGPLGFGEEVVSIAPAKSLRRADLLSWDALKSASRPLYRRSEIVDSFIVLASLDVSIAEAVIVKQAGKRGRVPVFRDSGFVLKSDFDGLDTVLHVFDPAIEHLEVADDGRAFLAKFRGRSAMVLSKEGLSEVLSSGTYRGIALIGRAMSTLRFGGYLLVDEIENHLNRQLVNVVLDLFASKETNPHGATLVFTTHYPQLLDHVRRKDNIYFLASTYGNGSRVVKYCDQVKRIENKKSEVFISNFVKGTAPRYVDVKSLKTLIAERVAENG